MMPAYRHVLGSLVAALTALLTLEANAETNRATFPGDFDKYILYATYDRGSAKEEAFATPETIQIAKAGKPLPPGTRLVLGIWKNAILTSYFVMEKGVDWGLDYKPEQRAGDWHFQEFDPKGKVLRTAVAERCQSCHQGQASNDFMFTLDRMRAFRP